MKTKIANHLIAALPLLTFTAILTGLLLARLMLDRVLPAWGAWGLGIAWCVMVFDYLVRAELFKQIGGFAVTLLAVLILTGALLPQQQVARYPHIASAELVDNMESAWTAVYSGNIFKTYSLKDQLLAYGTSLENFDPFRAGKMILYALLGFALAVVYLFPLEPWRRRFETRNLILETENGETKLDTGSLTLETSATSNEQQTMARGPSYMLRFHQLVLCGVIFALQVELLQVLSPTRLFTLRSVVDCSAGLLLGLLLFIPLHLFYLALAKRRAKGSCRFNVLGIGVDAVNMAGCLQRFERIIEGTFSVWGEENCHEKHKKSQKEKLSNCDPIRQLATNTQNPLPHNQSQITNNSGQRPVMTTALGVAGIVEARRNQKLQRILNESVLNTPDGMPLVWLGKLFGYRTINRVYGPDLLRDVCAYGESRGWSHFFYGAAPGIVEKLKDALEKKHPEIDIAGIYCPPFRPLTPEEEADLIAQVAASKPDIFWIGISTPKQLYFMDQMRDKLDCKIICPVGYAFDVNAGVQEDAPDWAKYSGFQWLHRAIKQPRLWKRYLPDNPRFVFEVFLQILHLKKFPMFLHERIQKPEKDAEGFFRFPAGIVSLSAMTLQSARDRVLNWIFSGQKHYVNICTADTMVQCFDHPELAKIVKNAGMATTDGMPLVWLARHYGFSQATRVYGPDLMLALCGAGQGENCHEEHKKPQKEENSARSTQKTSSSSAANAAFAYPSQDETGGLDLGGGEKLETRNSKLEVGSEGRGQLPTSNSRLPTTSPQGISHFFYGATDEVLQKLKANLLEKFPDLQIAGMYSPPFRPLTENEKDDVSSMINASGADIVWCGLGTPKQDYWVAEFRPRLNAAAILAVGAAFNFHAGEVRQAPRWMGRCGLEWLFRLGMEPKRLWRRYVIGNPRFICLVIGQLLYRGRPPR